MNGWGLILSAAIFGFEAVRVYRREPGVRRPVRRRSTMEAMASVGGWFGRRTAVRLGRPPDPVTVRRSGLATSPAEVGAARLGFAAVFGWLGLVAAVAVGGIADRRA